MNVLEHNFMFLVWYIHENFHALLSYCPEIFIDWLSHSPSFYYQCYHHYWYNVLASNFPLDPFLSNLLPLKSTKIMYFAPEISTHTLPGLVAPTKPCSTNSLFLFFFCIAPHRLLTSTLCFLSGWHKSTSDANSYPFFLLEREILTFYLS